MTKSQLILLLLIILIFYLSAESQAKPSPKGKWILPKKPQSTEPFSATFGLNPPHSQLNEPPVSEPKPKKPQEDEPTINCPAAILKNSETTQPTEINCPAAEFLSEDDALQETYRQHFLTLLSNFPLTPLIQSATNTLQTKNKPLSDYFQALWNLKGLANFPLLAQPLREWINLTTAFKPASASPDYGWLTDDNLEFILNNYNPIQVALAKNLNFYLRTDLANLYQSFQASQTNQEWDLPEFIQGLEFNKAPYTLFPLRVSGNHWGLFILENLTWQELTPTYQVYYTSSGGVSLQEEKQQLQPFISQICGENTPIQIILPADRQSKGYECGVYLVFYLQEILETGKLELKRQHSTETCQQFRWEWKERIGKQWCQ